ncbi:MAG: UDP-N-acetylmuramyl-tripeptide synthetase [bacterium]|nr:UDP-N-acetylmuramyl-tripeptide synthetase [bacterium]
MTFLKSLYHFFLAWLGDFWYKHPSRELFVIGVTGTKGKSSVLELTNSLLEEAGKKTALISSVRFKINESSERNLTGMSMPGRFFIQRFLREAADQGCKYALIEVTSQGILQSRHRFIDFDAAMVTNIMPEHIDAHGSYENYRKTKTRFFKDVACYSKKKARFFFVNADMHDQKHFLYSAQGKGLITMFSKKDIQKLKIKTQLIGEFNTENIAASIAIARSCNIEWGQIKNAIEKFDGVPGRLEFVQKFPFSVIIDYAHTPDSLELVYQTLKGKRKSAEKLICVLGAAGGGRDVWKRPVMGAIAAKYCDEIVITDEDPFDDDPKVIADQIAQGIKTANQSKKYTMILNRREAIKAAIKMARKNDTVIITGKGCEPYMRLAKGKKMTWNEREVVTKILNSEYIEL